MRSILACLLFLAASSVSAQGIQSPYVPPAAGLFPPRPLVPPANPRVIVTPGMIAGVMPLGGFGMLGVYSTVPGFAGSGLLPVVNSFPGWYPYGMLPGFGGWAQPRVAGSQYPNTPKAIQNLASTREPDWLKLAQAEKPAELELVLPGPGTVWHNEKMIDGSGPTWTLRSGPLKPGTSTTFQLRFLWSKDGKEYQLERSVEAKAGEPTRLVVLAGLPVRN